MITIKVSDIILNYVKNDSKYQLIYYKYIFYNNSKHCAQTQA